jgi:diguanylate cyclase (GGDEF)-like protein/PAS domain S-box-containing protein
MELTLGLAAGELPNKVDDLLAYVHPADRERFRLELQAIRDRDGGALRTGIRMRHADSSYRWLEFEGASVPSSDRRNLRCVGLVRDTTDQKRAQERLLHNAVYDSLTSLPNRELFLDRLTGARRAVPNMPRRNIAVLVVDVDRFRSVNASFGLVVGDSIILTVSRRIARILGPDGNLARIGGDQFALFMTDYVDTREIATLAERLRLALRSPIRIAGQEVVLTGSIGIAIDDGTAERVRDLMRYAETAMHRAKRLGSDRAEIYSPDMQSEQSERADIEADLAKAIEERRLTLLYQPIVNLSNDELVGFEAVVRWKHPRLGVIAPTELLAGSDRAELSTRLTAFVMQRAIADLARWQQELPRPEHPMFVVVGLGNRQLLTTELVQEVKQVKSRVVLPPGCLKLSVPEAVVMDNPEQASHVLDLLRDTGVELWMDGFATGYSSLSYLGRFPFDTFRIDRTLVELSGQGDRDASLVRSIVAVAHELGRKVMGQGVEAAEDAAFLRAIGCHYAQGFHYGEPMGEDETLRLLRLIRKSERRMRRRGMVRGQEKRKAGEGAAAGTAPGSDATAPPATPAVAPAAPPAGSRPAPASAPSQAQPYTQPPATRPPAGPMSPPWRPDVQPVSQPVRTMPPAGHRPPPGQAPSGPLPTPPGPISRPLTQPPMAAPSSPLTQPPGSRAPAPPQPPDVAPARMESNGRSAPDPLPPLREPPGPASTPPQQMAPLAREPEPGTVPTRPTLQRMPQRALSPAIAASLARLAGKASEDPAGETPARNGAVDDAPGTPPSPRGIKAAE